MDTIRDLPDIDMLQYDQWRTGNWLTSDRLKLPPEDMQHIMTTISSKYPHPSHSADHKLFKTFIITQLLTAIQMHPTLKTNIISKLDALKQTSASYPLHMYSTPMTNLSDYYVRLIETTRECMQEYTLHFSSLIALLSVYNKKTLISVLRRLAPDAQVDIASMITTDTTKTWNDILSPLLIPGYIQSWENSGTSLAANLSYVEIDKFLTIDVILWPHKLPDFIIT